MLAEFFIEKEPFSVTAHPALQVRLPEYRQSLVHDESFRDLSE